MTPADDAAPDGTGVVDPPIAEANPLRRQVFVALVIALALALVFAAVERRNDPSTAESTVFTTTTRAPTTEPLDPVAATVVFEDGTSVEVSRALVESLTGLILGNDEFLNLSFENPSPDRVRTRVTRNLVMSEIARNASPDPVDPDVFALVRDEQIQQVLFELTVSREDAAASRAHEIIESVSPYVDILAETVARSGQAGGILELAASATILIDGDIGVWDPVAVDVFG